MITTNASLTILLPLSDEMDVTNFAVNKFHLTLTNSGVQKVITQNPATGAPHTVTLTEEGIKFIGVPFEVGLTLVRLYVSDNADLDGGTASLRKLASGSVKRVVDTATLVLS